jgi:hypothetical protein
MANVYVEARPKGRQRRVAGHPIGSTVLLKLRPLPVERLTQRA